MSITRETVRYVANLARLGISNDEEELFTKQLANILEYVQKIKQLETTNIEPTFHTIDVYNITRNDEVKQGIDREKYLNIAPLVKDGQFVVPKIIE
ncbi:MAG: Asp-tRNA(Asn)/Glu-tRNA(Gln) amidotransferase subunit GatC [Candidatus Hydrogenedentota bacterium]